MDEHLEKVVWSFSASEDLDDIEEYYLNFHSPDKTSEKIINLILSVEETVFTKQWQVDEYDPSSRRVIVNKKFRVLYRVVGNVIVITKVYPTQKDPEGILKKRS